MTCETISGLEEPIRANQMAEGAFWDRVGTQRGIPRAFPPNATQNPRLRHEPSGQLLAKLLYSKNIRNH